MAHVEGDGDRHVLAVEGKDGVEKVSLVGGADQGGGDCGRVRRCQSGLEEEVEVLVGEAINGEGLHLISKVLLDAPVEDVDVVARFRIG